MSAHQAKYPIRTMARVLKVSASGYYAWRSRPASARATADAGLTRHIRTIHTGSHGTYGAPRVHAELKADGLSVGRKRVSRLMRVAGIAGVSRRRSAPITTRQATGHHPASDLVRRNFVAERPNELWVADITFLTTLAGFLLQLKATASIRSTITFRKILRSGWIDDGGSRPREGIRFRCLTPAGHIFWTASETLKLGGERKRQRLAPADLLSTS